MFGSVFAVTVLILALSPSIIAQQSIKTSNNVSLQIFGGIGVHFKVTNYSPYNITAEYTIARSPLPIVREGEISVTKGNTLVKSIYPFSFCSGITVSLVLHGEQSIIKTGFIIGIFVIFIDEN